MRICMVVHILFDTSYMSILSLEILCPKIHCDYFLFFFVKDNISIKSFTLKNWIHRSLDRASNSMPSLESETFVEFCLRSN
jgi:hypothetical protein